MIKRVFLILIALIPLSVFAQKTVGNWNIYPRYSAISKMVQTPQKVYFLSGGNLYSYDKVTQETYNYTSCNKLHDNNVIEIYYNKEKDYLVITYDTGNIDLLYNNGDIKNLPIIKDAVLTYEPDINDVAFDGDYIYFATKFGLIVFDEKKQEVKSSGIYGKEISLVTTVGDYVVIDQNHSLYFMHKGGRFETFENFSKISSGYWIDDIEGLNGDMALYRASNNSMYLLSFKFSNNTLSRTNLNASTNSSTLIYGKDAYYYVADSVLNEVSLEGVNTAYSKLPNELLSQEISIWDNKDEVWAGDANGIANYNITGGELSIIKEKTKPTSLSVNYPFYITSDQNGKIYVSNHGESRYMGFSGTWWYSYISTIDIDGKIEDITPIGLEVTDVNNPASNANRNDGRLYDTFQLVIDPEDPETYYITTYWDGIYKVKNGKMLSHYHSQASYDKDYVKGSGQKYTPDTVFPATSSLVAIYGCRTFGLTFDRENNLWCVNEVFSGSPSLHMLPAEARKKEATTPDDWVPITLGTFTGGRDIQIIACKKSNMIFICDGQFSSPVVAYDTKGTYSDTSDDTFYLWDSFIDQDGKVYNPDRTTAFAEDEYGRVWIGTSNGVIEITDPSKATDPTMTVKRLKLLQDDGSEAGYLLDGIHVTTIAVDKNNKKWLGTLTDGVYYVNEDATKILQHFTSDNSYHPGGVTYSVYINPTNNSVFIGTQNGLVEYNGNSSSAKEDYNDVYTYPNPVEPDYTGWITIKGLMDNSFVNIYDPKGNLFYTTRSQGGIVIWDGCDSNGQRVKAGVYTVKASQKENDAAAPNVTKIMVVD